MTPWRLLIFGFLVVIAVAGLKQFVGTAGRPLGQRRTEAFKNAALTAFIFGLITILFTGCVTSTVGVVANALGFERRRDHDVRQRRALARLVALDATLVEPPIRGDPEARAVQALRQAKAEQDRARVWKRFAKANERRILPGWFTTGEEYLVVVAPLLFFVWAWTWKDESKATGRGRAMAATKGEVPGDPKPTAMSRGQAMELWFWCWAAVAEREARFGPGCETPSVRWQVSACLRIQAAFEKFHRNGSSSQLGIHDALEDRLTRGLDPVGVVLFDRYLNQQRRHWNGRLIGGSAPDEAEAKTRLSVIEAAARVFHRIVGATSDAIELEAAELPIATDARRLQTGLRMGGVLIYDETTEGPIPPEEEAPRWAEATRRVHAGTGGLKS